MSTPLVVVTGVSGFLGAHVVDQLVKEGSRVRGIARGAKVGTVQAAYDAAYGTGKIEIFAVDDLVTGDFGSSLQGGVVAVIHVASPLSSRIDDPEDTLNVAIEGTTNILKQAQKAGVKKFSIASSIASALDPSNPKPLLTENDWNPVTREQATDGTRTAFFVYSASKTLSEKAVWAFAEEHPDLSVTTLNPSYFIGPNAPGQIVTPGDLNALSTNLKLYNILFPDTKDTTPIGFVDVRDVARGLVAGIKISGRNRILLSGEWFDYADAINYISNVRPELLPRLGTVTRTGQKASPVDNSRAYEILGVPPVIPWETSVIETVNTLIQAEKDWEKAGIDVENTLKKNNRRA